MLNLVWPEEETRQGRTKRGTPVLAFYWSGQLTGCAADYGAVPPHKFLKESECSALEHKLGAA